MNLVSLLVLPAIINVGTVDELTTTDVGQAVRAVSNFSPSGLSYAIAGVALVILVGAVAFSKRRVSSIDMPDTPATLTPADDAPPTRAEPEAETAEKAVAG
jgi:hypothetical protein